MNKRNLFTLKYIIFNFIFLILFHILFVLYWYPGVLLKATGGQYIYIILIIINIIVFPILIFGIYKEQKKSLKSDLLILFIVQLIIFSYSFYTLEQGRPIWLVHSIDKFQLIRKNEIVVLPNQYIDDRFKKRFWSGPQYVLVQLSKNKKQREDDMFNAVFGLTIANQPSRYLPFNSLDPEFFKYVRHIPELVKFNNKELTSTILKKYPQADAWLPLKANALDMVVLINKEKAEVVKIVDLRPWN